MTTLTSIAVVVGVGVLSYIVLYFLMGYLEKPKNPRLANTINIVGGFILVMLFVGVFIYLFILSPAFVEKPYVEKPPLDTENMQTGALISGQHIKYLINEAGGYRLHDDSLTKTRPQFEFYLTDVNQTYNVVIIDNRVYVQEEKLNKPDAKVYITQETMIQLFKSENFKEELVSLVKERKITAQILADKTTLALKGYLALYNEMNK